MLPRHWRKLIILLLAILLGLFVLYYLDQPAGQQLAVGLLKGWQTL